MKGCGLALLAAVAATPMMAVAQGADTTSAPPGDSAAVGDLHGSAVDGAVVNGVLFYSPTCPHCRDVMTEGLPPILARYGDALNIIGVNTAAPGGEQLYRAAIQDLFIPRDRLGVPTLLVGSRVLVGGFEIPNLLPPIVEEGLAAGGVDWPPVPLIRRALEAQGVLAVEPAAEPVPTDPEPDPAVPAPEVGFPDPAPEAGSPDPAPAPVEPASGTSAADSALAGAIAADTRAALAHSLPVWERLQLDPAGNGTALAVLVLMLAALGLVAWDRTGDLDIPAPPPWAIPALTAVGVAVAAYLAFVEVTGTEAVCGPVGDCNTVQQSPYARVFGVPVGLLGVVGYITLAAVWGLGRVGDGLVTDAARRLVWWMALAATAFSLYLTVLEPFVIGASCAWCLTSALATTLILIAATGDLPTATAAGRTRV